MHNIKVGDTVRRILAIHSGMNVGDLATVIKVGDNWICLAEYGGLMAMHEASNLEVVTFKDIIKNTRIRYLRRKKKCSIKET